METARSGFVCPPNVGASKRKRIRSRGPKNLSSLSQRLNPDFDPAKQITQNFSSLNGNGQSNTGGSKSSTVSLATSDTSSASDRQGITTSFKLQILNTTLKFIKDPDRTILEYPEMSLYEGQFVLSLLENRSSTNLGLGFKTLYAPLHEIIKKISDTYELKISFLETMSVKTMRLMLQKILKRALQNNMYNKSEDLNTSNISQSSVDSEKSVDRGKISNQDLIQRLPDAFIQDILEKVVKFFEDEQMASMEFKNLFDKEAEFTQMLPTMCRDQKLYNLFTPECLTLVHKIKMANNEDVWRLSVVSRKMNGHKRAKLVTYSKVPVHSKKKEKTLRSVVFKKENSAEPQKTNNVTTNHKQNESIQQTNKHNSENNVYENTSQKETKDRTSSDRQHMPERDRELESIQLKLLKHANGNKAKQYIAFQSAGLQDVDMTGAGDVPAGEVPPLTASDVCPKHLSIKQKRILEALATPFENDRAERMMRIMGWEGGALGTRGDGLTEPIIPALHIKPGAGLGHIKQSQEQQASQFSSPLAFRVDFLKRFLTFIESNEDRKLFSYKEPLAKRELRFIRPTIRAFNMRKFVGLNSDEEIDLVTRICNVMSERLTLNIILTMNDAKTKFELTKENMSQTTPPPRRRKKTRTRLSNSVSDLTIEVKTDRFNDSCDVKTINDDKSERFNDSCDVKTVNDDKNERFNDSCDVKTVNDARIDDDFERIGENDRNDDDDNSVEHIFSHDIENMAYSLSDYRAKKSAKTTGFRVIFLELLKKFLNGKRKVLEVKMENMMNKKNRAYIENVILEINRKKWTSKNTYIENKIYEEIQDIAADCYLSIAFEVRKFYLQKKFYQKRFTNSALTSVPPPVSKDIKNTVIYVNNVPYPAERFDENLKKQKQNDEIDNKNNDVSKNNYDISKKNDNVSKNNDSDDKIDDIDDKYDVIINKHNVSNKTDKSDDMADSDEDVLVINDSSAVEFESDGDILSASEEKMSKCDDSTKDTISLDISSESMMIDIKCNSNENIDQLKANYSVNSEVNNNHDIIIDKNDDLVNFKSLLNHTDDSNHSSKRSSSASSIQSPKKMKFVKHIAVILKDSFITPEIAQSVQNLISKSIDETLPQLECHGIQNGGLIYSCYNEKSFEWLKNILSVATEINIVDAEIYENIYKLQLKINSYVKTDVKEIFELLELYNTDISTNKWVVLDEKYYENSILVIVNMDENSFKYIRENDFSLFAGIDKVKFSIVWD